MAITNFEIIETEKALRNITEEIHTFQKWKSLGYSVKKGEKSDIIFPIWKYAGKKGIDEETGEEKEINPHCFMKTAYFFKQSQVEKIKARG